MVTKNASTEIVKDYLSALLMDVSAPDDSAIKEKQESAKAFKFAGVASGFEVVKLWTVPSNNAQALWFDLVLLSHVKPLAPSRLKQALLSAVRVVN